MGDDANRDEERPERPAQDVGDGAGPAAGGAKRFIRRSAAEGAERRQRKRDEARRARAAAAGEGLAGVVARAGGSAAAGPGRHGPRPHGRPGSGPGHRPGGPRGGHRGGPKGGPRGGAKSGAKGRGAKGRAPAVDPARLKRREEAEAMSKAKGIPLAHAHRILQGQTTLNDVLKLLMRKDRFERLVRREGLDPSLAGQVASGHLTRERALLVTRIRKHRNRPLDHDPLKAAFKRGGELALWLFGEGWVRGSLVGHKVYEVELLEPGAEAPRVIPKHEVKAVAAPRHADAVAAAATRDETVAAEGLASTQDRAERIRPSDEWLLKAAEGGEDVTFIFRDGDVLTGRLMSFGRWDAALDVEAPGAAGEDTPARVPVEIFFHSLHKSTLDG